MLDGSLNRFGNLLAKLGHRPALCCHYSSIVIYTHRLANTGPIHSEQFFFGPSETLRNASSQVASPN